MKKSLLYLTLGLSLSLLFVIALSMQEKRVGKILTVSTEYLYLYDDEGEMRFMFFINQKHPITSVDYINNLYLHNEMLTEKIPLNVIEITKSHEERYLNETYMAYEIMTDMPYMGKDYALDDAYLSIHLSNDDVYTLFMGYLSIMTHEESVSHLDWHNLYGLKQEGSSLSRLYHIDIYFNTLNEPIEKIELGSIAAVGLILDERKLRITIEDAPYLLYHAPLKIIYSNGDVQCMEGFTYIKDYEILKESGLIVHHGTLN